jgi:hypothetical protein
LKILKKWLRLQKTSLNGTLIKWIPVSLCPFCNQIMLLVAGSSMLNPIALLPQGTRIKVVVNQDIFNLQSNSKVSVVR